MPAYAYLSVCAWIRKKQWVRNKTWMLIERRQSDTAISLPRSSLLASFCRLLVFSIYQRCAKFSVFTLIPMPFLKARKSFCQGEQKLLLSRWVILLFPKILIKPLWPNSTHLLVENTPTREVLHSWQRENAQNDTQGTSFWYYKWNKSKDKSVF